MNRWLQKLLMMLGSLGAACHAQSNEVAIAPSSASGSGSAWTNPVSSTEPVASLGDGPMPSTSSRSLAPGDCDAGDPAFIKRAMLGVLGRRPISQAEVDVYVDALLQLQSGAAASAFNRTAARRTVVHVMMQEDAFRLRWSDFLKDTLRVARTQTKSSETCYGATDDAVSGDTASALAVYVRDNDPNQQTPPLPGFTMRELLASALALDDLSVVYRAHVFAMLGRPMTGNSAELELERARRSDFGAAFEATYTRREIECLGCHNSEFSVSASQDSETNRFWPVPGTFERALFGSATGRHPSTDVGDLGSDVMRARGMFRVLGVANATGIAPYGWNGVACGTFSVPDSDDPLQVDTYFGSIHSTSSAPTAGLRASVWDLERALHRGVDALAAAGPALLDPSADPDQAFAYLTALSIVESVWTEVVGRPLTIAHHFPRTAVQRDVLSMLTNGFVASHFSLKRLLLEIVLQPTFNLAAPNAGCGSGPYPLPRLFDPWTDAALDAAERGNGPSDAVFPLSPRVIRRSLHASMEWPLYREYPAAGSPEETLALALGFFLRDAEPGRRDLDFQGRLAWEAAYGACPKLADEDYISRLAARFRDTPHATVRDAVAALKDRLVGDGTVTAEEQPLVEALMAVPLDGSDPGGHANGDIEGPLRRLCGALVASPGFQLGGLVLDASRGAPLLAPATASYEVLCPMLRERLRAVGAPLDLTCAP